MQLSELIFREGLPVLINQIDPDEIIVRDKCITQQELLELINDPKLDPSSYPSEVSVLVSAYHKARSSDRILRGKIVCILQKLCS